MMQKLALILFAAGNLTGCNQPLEVTPLPQPAFDQTALLIMLNSVPTNSNHILQQKQLLNTNISNDNFTTINPYQPLMKMSWADCWLDLNCHYSITQTGFPVQAFPASQQVFTWWNQRHIEADSAAVCGIQFNPEKPTQYQLASFENLTELEHSDGFHLTHYQSCGTCSSLQDLAIYGSLDLTVMAKTCSKRLHISDKKSCMQDIGFSEACAESWAYNAAKTTQSCFAVCVQEYGLIALLMGTESSPTTSPNGQLNACLLCDEMMSGPGFQYSAGRTRRNSGITSEINRPDDQVYIVEHDYFE